MGLHLCSHQRLKPRLQIPHFCLLVTPPSPFDKGGRHFRPSHGINAFFPPLPPPSWDFWVTFYWFQRPTSSSLSSSAFRLGHTVSCFPVLDRFGVIVSVGPPRPCSLGVVIYPVPFSIPLPSLTGVSYPVSVDRCINLSMNLSDSVSAAEIFRTSRYHILVEFQSQEMIPDVLNTSDRCSFTQYRPFCATSTKKLQFHT